MKFKTFDRIIRYLGTAIYGFMLVTAPSVPEPFIPGGLEQAVHGSASTGKSKKPKKNDKEGFTLSKEYGKKFLKIAPIVNVSDVISRALSDFDIIYNNHLEKNPDDIDYEGLEKFRLTIVKLLEDNFLYEIRSDVDHKKYCQGKNPVSVEACEKATKNANTDNNNKIQKQCSPDPSCIFFPEYGVTTGDSENPILATGWIIDCISLVIDHRLTKKSLMAHINNKDNHKNLSMPDTDENRGYSKEEYIGFFKENYFSNLNPEELDIYIRHGLNTDEKEVLKLEAYIKEYFPGANLTTKKITGKTCHVGEIIFDSRTGKVTTQDWPAYFLPQSHNMKWSVCIPLIKGEEFRKTYTINDIESLRPKNTLNRPTY
jgi:hypothetical protein